MNKILQKTKRVLHTIVVTIKKDDITRRLANFSFSQSSSFFRQKTEGVSPSVKTVSETDQNLDKQHVDVIYR